MMNIAFNSEPRISTSVTGLLTKPTLDQRMRGINKLFYSLLVNAKANDDRDRDAKEHKEASLVLIPHRHKILKRVFHLGIESQ